MVPTPTGPKLLEEPNLKERAVEIAGRLVCYLAEHKWAPVEVVHDQFMLEVNPVVRSPEVAFILWRRCHNSSWELLAKGQTEDGTLVDQDGHHLTLTPYTTDLIEQLLSAAA